MSQTHCHQSPSSILLCVSHMLPVMMAFLSKSHGNSIPWESCPLGARSLPKRIHHALACHTPQGTAQGPLPTCSQKPDTFSQPGEKASEGMDTLSVLQFKRDLKRCRILQTSGFCHSGTWCRASRFDLWIAQSFGGARNVLMACTVV